MSDDNIKIIQDADQYAKVINQQLWNFQIELDNNKQIFQLSPHAFKQIVIEDDMLSWPLKGFIIIDNRMEAFERSYDGKDFFYHIRADSRDKIKIKIWPTSEGELPDDIWKIELDAVIYDVEDLITNSRQTKAKKLYFWDEKFQFLQEKTIQWSTADGPLIFTKETENNIPIAHRKDENRSMYIGEAIASILASAGYLDFIDEDNWDLGAGKICYNTKADWSIWENIQYLLNNMVSREDKGFVNLTWDRRKNKFQLRSFKKDILEAGKDQPGIKQLEHLFYLEKQEEKDSTSSISPFKAPYSEAKNETRDLKILPYNIINNYRFSQTSGLDNSKAFLTRPVYSHWHKKKQFQVDVKENEIQNVKKFFKDNYVSKLRGNDYTVMTLNETKKKQLSISPVFSPISILNPEEDRYNRSNVGRGSILFAGVFLNQCLALNLLGSTHRHSNTFVGVDHYYENSDTDYDYQICGQFYVVKVVHNISYTTYTNELTLVKIHAYDKLLDDESVD